MKNKYICIHGHFYQPPRENPWLNEVERQDSAYPFHDWNERITEECYARNAASRIQDDEGRIVDIINNYSRISFNFGPTLLAWIEKHSPETYQAILEADKISQKKFSGHGSAIAQVYNHMIMPLSNKQDQETQVVWGIRDFEKRFGRKPEGMWLAETAANTDSLEMLAAHGVKFTILSPYQAKRIRPIGQKEWMDASDAKVDPRRPYRCKLPSGRSIVLFFYNGPVSQGIAFEGLLNSGEAFARRLIQPLEQEPNTPQLMHIATDGETYGHHHKLGEMALSYCLYHIEEQKLASITIYGEYLEKYPPEYEAEIIEDSSWSCYHGVERWRSNCGCNTGGKPGWNQNWRGPFRDALDWVRQQCSALYESFTKEYTDNPWKLRNEYIDVILDRSEENINRFFEKNINRQLSNNDKVKLLKLLEMQYHTMLMYTSCGWFFDEITGIETIQDMFYAARALQLAQNLSGEHLEEKFIDLLALAPSNVPAYKNAANAYMKHVQPAVLDLMRVGAHYAISSLFKEYPEFLELYSYTAKSERYELIQAGREKLAFGRAKIKSKVTWAEKTITFAILHLGEHHMFGGVREFSDDQMYLEMERDVKEAFMKSNVFEVMMLMDKHFGSHNYSFWHLFKDDQQSILEQVLEQNSRDVERQFEQVYENNFPLILAIMQLQSHLPTPLRVTVDFVLNARLKRILQQTDLNLKELKRVLEEAQRLSVELDKLTLDYLASEQLTNMMKKLAEDSSNMGLMTKIIEVINLISEAGLEPELWWAQNYGFQVKKKIKAKITSNGDEPLEDTENLTFINLLNTLNIKP